MIVSIEGEIDLLLSPNVLNSLIYIATNLYRREADVGRAKAVFP